MTLTRKSLSFYKYKVFYFYLELSRISYARFKYDKKKL